MGVNSGYWYINTDNGIVCKNDNCELVMNKKPEDRDIFLFADKTVAEDWLDINGSVLTNPVVEWWY